MVILIVFPLSVNSIACPSGTGLEREPILGFGFGVGVEVAIGVGVAVGFGVAAGSGGGV
jgi:hypothetical protein